MCIRDSRKDGSIKGYPDTLVTDLPGIYSMSPYSSEEIVSRNFILYENCLLYTSRCNRRSHS